MKYIVYKRAKHFIFLDIEEIPVAVFSMIPPMAAIHFDRGLFDLVINAATSD